MICAATLLAEIGDCHGRYPHHDAIAAQAGHAPVAVESGKRKHAKFRWACNKRLRRALNTVAMSTARWNPWPADRYAQARQRGHNHRRAPRTVGRAWSRILGRCWPTRTPYDPIHGTPPRNNTSPSHHPHPVEPPPRPQSRPPNGPKPHPPSTRTEPRLTQDVFRYCAASRGVSALATEGSPLIGSTGRRARDRLRPTLSVARPGAGSSREVGGGDPVGVPGGPLHQLDPVASGISEPGGPRAVRASGILLGFRL